MADRKAKSSVVRKLLRGLRGRVALWVHQLDWFRHNRHNDTTAHNLFQRGHVQVGRYTYGPIHVLDGPGSARLTIGDYCSIAEGAVFILNAEHRTDSLLSFPVRTFVLNVAEDAHTRGDIVVGDDVWVGYGAIILSGVSIGRGSVIAAGSVVSRDVPSYAIVAGVPARPIGSRFEESLCRRLVELDFSAITRSFVDANRELLEAPLDGTTAREIASRLDRRAE